jgi:hypothetical protein
VGILPYFDRNLFENYDNGHGSSFVYHRNRDPVFPLKSGFRSDGALDSDADVLVVPVDLRPLADLPWEDGRFALKLSRHWRYCKYFDGHLWQKMGYAMRHGFAIYASAEVVERLGIRDQMVDTYPRGTAGGIDVADYPESARRHVDLVDAHVWARKLLRKIAPDDAIDQTRAIGELRQSGARLTADPKAANRHSRAGDKVGAILAKPQPEASIMQCNRLDFFTNYPELRCGTLRSSFSLRCGCP